MRGIFKVLSIAAAAALLLAVSGSAGAQTDSGACGEETTIISPTDGQNLVGSQELAVLVSDNNPVQGVEFFAGDDFIGRANDGGNGTWGLNWDTTTAGEDAAEITAKVALQSGRELTSCSTESIAVSIDNADKSEIEIELSQLEWAGPANFKFGLDGRVLVRNGAETTDVTEASRLEWVTDIGALESSGNSAELFSGPLLKSGRITATAYYGTQQAHIDFNVAVVDEGRANNYPFGSSDEALDACLAETLAGRYDTIVADGLRFNNSDLSAGFGCFEDRNYLLPVNLAPVSPLRISSLDVNESLVVDSLEYVENQASVVSALIISGRSAPDSDIIVYISSTEALVAVTRTDENGEWSYVLSDPLAAGGHEITAVSEVEEDFYRSAPYRFSIEKSEGSAKNPEGLSLRLADSSARPLTYLVWVAVVSLIFAAGLLFAIHHRTKIRHPDHDS